MRDSPLDQEYPLVAPYSRYARLYDELGQSEFALALAPLIDLAIHRHRVPIRTALDLACGTGAMAVHLAKEGYEVIAVDRSIDMLRVAEERARQEGVNATFFIHDMTRLRLDQTVDLVLCLYDSVNHLLSIRDLESAFTSVAQVLNPGGLFIFDVNTVYCLAQNWGNQVLEEQSKSATLMHLYSFDPRSRIGTLELFCLSNAGNRIEKFREIHRERGYTREEISDSLHFCGLAVLEEFSFPDLAAPGDTTSRLIYVATPAPSSGHQSHLR